MADETNKNKYLNDALLIAGLVLVCALSFFAYFFMHSGRGVSVRIEVNGKTVDVLPLDTDTVVKISGTQSADYLTIKSGKAYMSEAGCPDKVCVSQGEISRTGESIICLPNRIVVTIEGNNKSEDDIDAYVR